MSTDLITLEASLRKRCEQKPGQRHRKQEPNSKNDYCILAGFLGSFARFFNRKQQRCILLRAYDEVWKKQRASGTPINLSKTMKWDTEGWSWVELSLCNPVTEETLNALIDDSYAIACNELDEWDRQTLALVTACSNQTEALEWLINAYGLGAERERVLSLVRPCILFHTHPTDQPDFAPGRTRIGGEPELPDDIPWPEYHDKGSMSFLAQINLAELAQFPAATALPRQGMLYFFSVFGWQNEDDSDPALPDEDECYANGTHVIYVPDQPVATTPRPTPDDVNDFPPAQGRWVSSLSLPHTADTPDIAAFGWDDATKDRFKELSLVFSLYTQHIYDGAQRNQILGHPDLSFEHPPQTPRQTPCDLLFQLASDHHAEMCWGDGGYIFFWIDPEDMTKAIFSHIPTSYECG